MNTELVGSAKRSASGAKNSETGTAEISVPMVSSSRREDARAFASQMRPGRMVNADPCVQKEQNIEEASVGHSANTVSSLTREVVVRRSALKNTTTMEEFASHFVQLASSITEVLVMTFATRASTSRTESANQDVLLVWNS